MNKKEILKTIKAMGQSKRLEIFWLLMSRKKGLLAAEIANRLKISTTLFSHHAKILKESNCVETFREGKGIRYFAKEINITLKGSK